VADARGARASPCCDCVKQAWLSDHLCWGGAGGHYAHDLLPLPYTDEALEHVVARIAEAQEVLRRRILVENVSSYLTFADSTITEWDFVAETARRADCGILLDVINVYVSAVNHGFDPQQYILALPRERVGQIHLAGHTDLGTHLLDTHDGHVVEPVWQLYRLAIERFGPVSTLIESDDHVPELEVLLAETERARTIESQVCCDAARCT